MMLEIWYLMLLTWKILVNNYISKINQRMISTLFICLLWNSLWLTITNAQGTKFLLFPLYSYLLFASTYLYFVHLFYLFSLGIFSPYFMCYHIALPNRAVYWLFNKAAKISVWMLFVVYPHLFIVIVFILPIISC